MIAAWFAFWALHPVLSGYVVAALIAALHAFTVWAFKPRSEADRVQLGRFVHVIDLYTAVFPDTDQAATAIAGLVRAVFFGGAK